MKFGDININIAAANFDNPANVSELMGSVANMLQAETEEAIIMARRLGDLNEKNADRSV